MVLWEKLISFRIMELASLIIMGDFNCIIGLDEQWGGSTKIDPLESLICEVIIDHNLVDICPQSMVPTWYIGKAGMAYVAKRLDRFVLHESLVEHLGNVDVGVINIHLSNHQPITL